jgi:hypothetical protein
MKTLQYQHTPVGDVVCQNQYGLTFYLPGELPSYFRSCKRPKKPASKGAPQAAT